MHEKSACRRFRKWRIGPCGLGGQQINGACTLIVHTILGGSPVILWISLGGKSKWLPLKFGYHDEMRTSPIDYGLIRHFQNGGPIHDQFVCWGGGGGGACWPFTKSFIPLDGIRTCTSGIRARVCVCVYQFRLTSTAVKTRPLFAGRSTVRLEKNFSLLKNFVFPFKTLCMEFFFVFVHSYSYFSHADYAR